MKWDVINAPFVSRLARIILQFWEMKISVNSRQNQKKKEKKIPPDGLMCASRAGDVVQLLNATVFLPDSADAHDAAADLDGLQQRAARRRHVRGRSGSKLGPRRWGRWGRWSRWGGGGVTTPLIMCNQLTGSEPPRFFFFFFSFLSLNA